MLTFPKCSGYNIGKIYIGTPLKTYQTKEKLPNCEPPLKKSVKIKIITSISTDNQNVLIILDLLSLTIQATVS